jgi:predicted membrane channel-forming protein YqfA (hemolysin III family)
MSSGLALAVGGFDPSTFADTPWLRAVAAFLLVVPAGLAVLGRYGGVVDRSVEASLESPFVSVVYGFLAHIVLFFVAGVLSTQLANTGLDPTVLQAGSSATLGVIFLALAGLGFAVLGTWLVDLRGEGQRWHGFVAVAAVGAGVWLLPSVAGLVLWMLLVSVGVGGPTRRWIHAERSVQAEVERETE